MYNNSQLPPGAKENIDHSVKNGIDNFLGGNNSQKLNEHERGAIDRSLKKGADDFFVN